MRVSLFKDRNEAGARLARALEDYRGKNAVVLAIPRGGIEVGRQVVALLVPPYFRAVADFYQDWHDVSDEEALSILKESRQKL